MANLCFSLLLLLFTPTLTVVLSLSLPHLPLNVSSRWIDDASKRHLKLKCVNWPAHLQPSVAEGLNHRPLHAISEGIVGMGFNCVRLTWALFLLTNESVASLTVEQSLAKLGLRDAITGFKANNRGMLGLHLIDAFKAVVSSLGSHGLMVILDNHITEPEWCCRDNDGNGFFGDTYFDPKSWVDGLTKMATLSSGMRNVVGMSLRNELRGSKQNRHDWYRYMEEGAEAVHLANPHVLVILSGLSYSTDLSFLKNQSLKVAFREKVMYEFHWYKSTDKEAWGGGGRPKRVKACRFVKKNLSRRVLFLLKNGFPLFLSEFGLNLSVRNQGDYRYLGCLLKVVGELQLNWAYWNTVGSYYLREGVVESDEEYGLLTKDWDKPRNPGFLRMLSRIQGPITAV